MKKSNKPSVLRDILEIIAFFAVCALLIWLMLTAIRAIAGYVRSEAADGQLKADTVNDGDGVGRVTACLNGVLLLGGETDEPVRSTALRVYTEGVDNPMPEWWNPDEPMTVEWYAEEVEAEPHPPELISTNGVDWNIETDIHGWDGHTMTGVELDLFSRVFMLEFWGTSIECCEAGADAILNLWDSGLYGRTLCDCLWAKNEQGRYIYSVCNYLWDWDYDSEGLEWCREFCLERFIEGPRHETMYFQLYGFHNTSWTIPLFECDGVYFSKGK